MGRRPLHTMRGIVTAAIALAATVSRVAAQVDSSTHMGPVGPYLMDRSAEIALARSAAPASISGDATILVLGTQGYETAVSGTNGFVCLVGRSWSAAFDWPEFWNPRVRAADCMNPQSARAMVPIFLLRSRMAMAGRSKGEMLSAVKGAFAGGEVPRLEGGAMDYMMAKGAYLTDAGDHNMPHLMFLTADIAAKDWGADVPGSPVMAAPYWYFSSTVPSGLPPILVFLVGVTQWSDGTPAGASAN